MTGIGRNAYEVKQPKLHSAKQIEFDPDLLLQSLCRHPEHLEAKKKLILRVTSLFLLAPVQGLKPKNIVGIRQNLN
ncbi:MAG TPA: hypothetical protein VN578_08475 [Candidatus Binatia bacterium]|jgi:hypothetical protein|nr:hypothetical protein [Candidatus Binatia bacterium]